MLLYGSADALREPVNIFGRIHVVRKAQLRRISQRVVAATLTRPSGEEPVEDALYY